MLYVLGREESCTFSPFLVKLCAPETPMYLNIKYCCKGIVTLTL